MSARRRGRSGVDVPVCVGAVAGPAAVERDDARRLRDAAGGRTAHAIGRAADAVGRTRDTRGATDGSSGRQGSSGSSPRCSSSVVPAYSLGYTPRFCSSGTSRSTMSSSPVGVRYGEMLNPPTLPASA